MPLRLPLLALLLLAGCVTSTNGSEPGDMPPGDVPPGEALPGDDVTMDDCDALSQRLAAMEEEVMEAVGEAEAGDVAACRSVAFGAKPCGGPWTYLVYSTTGSDADEVQERVAEYNRLDERRNAACELVSTCEVTPEPALAVEAGRCVAVGRGDG